MGKESNSAIHIWLVLWKSTRAVEAYAHKSIQNLGLGLTDFAVLEALLHKGPLLISALGTKVLLTSGSITTAVDRLERQGFVVRQDDPTDRRARYVHLTPKGERIITKAFSKHSVDIDVLMSTLSNSEREQLSSSLRKLGKSAAQLATTRTSKPKLSERKGGMK